MFTYNPNSSLQQNGVKDSPPQSNHVQTTAIKEEEESATDYSDLEDSEPDKPPVSTAGQASKMDDDKSDFVNSGLVRESEIESVLAAVSSTASRMNFATTNSHGKESPKSSPKNNNTEKREEEILEEKSPGYRSPRQEGKLGKRASVGELKAQFERAAGTTSTGTPSITIPSSSNQRHGSHGGFPQSPTTPSDVSPSESSFSAMAVKPRSSSLHGENSATPSSTKHERTPSTRSTSSAGSPDNKRLGTSSEGIASRIASLFSRGSKDKISPLTESKTGNGKDAAANQNGQVRSPETPLANEMTSSGSFKGVSPSQMAKLKQSSVASSIGSDVLTSGDYSTTDVDSSFDLTSPPTSPASSLGTSSLARNITSPAKGNNGPTKLGAKKLKDTKKTARFLDVVDGEEEEEDVLGDLIKMDPKQRIRSRTKTLSSSSGVSRRTAVELGRNTRSKKEIQERQLKLKRHHSLTDLRLIGKEFSKELELISPDFESKIRERICQAISEKYGGMEKATQAAVKIQQSWRQYKLRSRFQKIKQQNKSQLQLQLRKRAQSMRDPKRRPSIMRKRNKVYHRESSTTAMSPMSPVSPVSPVSRATSKLATGKERHMLGQTRSPPTVKISEQFAEGVEEAESDAENDRRNTVSVCVCVCVCV